MCDLTLLDEALIHNRHQIWSTFEGSGNISVQAALDHKDSESGECTIEVSIFNLLLGLLPAVPCQN